MATATTTTSTSKHAVRTSSTTTFLDVLEARVLAVIETLADRPPLDAGFLAKHNIKLGNGNATALSNGRTRLVGKGECLPENWWASAKEEDHEVLGWVTLFEDGANCLKSKALPDHTRIPYPTALVVIHPPDEGDDWEFYLAHGANDKNRWRMESTLKPYEEDPEVFGCTLADAKTEESDFRHDCPVRNELVCLLFLLHRQVYRCPLNRKLTPGARFSVTVTAFTKTRIRVHEAYIVCPADPPQQEHTTLIHIDKLLDIHIDDVRKDAARSEECCLDVLSYLCYPVENNVLMPEPEKKPSETLASANKLSAAASAASLVDESNKAGTPVDAVESNPSVTKLYAAKQRAASFEIARDQQVEAGTRANTPIPDEVLAIENKENVSPVSGSREGKPDIPEKASLPGSRKLMQSRLPRPSKASISRKDGQKILAARKARPGNPAPSPQPSPTGAKPRST